MTNEQALAALSRVCREWGGSLLLVSQRTWDRLFEKDEEMSSAPFINNLGVYWHKKRVITVRETASPGAVIHEMGHVFIEAEPNLYRHEEFDWFGWEIALARKIGCFRAWSRGNQDYVVEFERVHEWGSLTQSQKRRLEKDRIDAALAKGYLDKNLQPLPMR